MRPFRLDPPEISLVPYEGVGGLKAHCRLDDDSEQALIEAYERSAVDYLDGYNGRLGRCILRQKWALPLTDMPQVVYLPFPDCREFTVERLDEQGEWTSETGVVVTQREDRVFLDELPDEQTGLHLICWAGWETVEDVPDNLKQAIRFLVEHWFNHRSAVAVGDAAQEVPMAVSAMISPLVHVFA